jgi:hypothetical protein
VLKRWFACEGMDQPIGFGARENLRDRYAPRPPAGSRRQPPQLVRAAAQRTAATHSAALSQRRNRMATFVSESRNRNTRRSAYPQNHSHERTCASVPLTMDSFSASSTPPSGCSSSEHA